MAMNVAGSTEEPFPLLMGQSTSALRAKLTRPDSALAPWWRHFVALARRDPEFFSPYTVLAALVTRDPVDRELARQAFMRFVELRKEGMVSQDAQFHTHVVSAALGRWAIYYDWIADEGILSPDEDEAFRAYLLDYSQHFAWQQASSRARSIDNQALSNAFGAAVPGYVLGVRRGQSPTARRLFRTGLDRLRYYFENLPPGGYLGEGSTYQEHVVVPVTLLAALFVESVTGNEPAGLRQVLDTTYKLVGPSALMPPWDHYGFMLASIKSGLTYLTQLTGDTNPLAIVRDCGLWYRTALPAWELDDRLWTLVFWPGNAATPAHVCFRPWMTPEVAGALQIESTRLRLFQYWDECGGVPSSGRAQVNPNAISLDVDGSPILLDGYGRPNPDPVTLQEEAGIDYVGRRVIDSAKEYAFSCWQTRLSDTEALELALDGNIGQSNSLVLDEEYWYVPHAPCRGVGEALHHVGPLQVLRSEAAAYYKDRYDVLSVTRTSVLVADRYILVTDRVQSATPHTVTWQAYLRQDARIDGRQVSIQTPEQIHCDVIPLQAGSLELIPVSGFPAMLGDGRSALMRHTLATATANARVDVLLVPTAVTALVEDISTGWTDTNGNGGALDLREAYLHDTNMRADARHFVRTVHLTPEEGCAYYLRIEAAGAGLVLLVNDRAIASTVHQSKGQWPASAACLAWVFDITAALNAGENRLEIRAPFFHGESVLGPVRLSVGIQPAPISAESTSDGVVCVELPSGTEWLLCDNREGVIPWATGKTDARYALCTADGAIAAVDVCRLDLCDELSVIADSPVDLCWSTLETQLARWIDGCTIQMRWDCNEMILQTGGCIDIVYRGGAAYRLRLDLPTPLSVIVNGVSLGIRQGLDTTHTLTPDILGRAKVATPTSTDEVYSLVSQPRDEASNAVVDLLRGADWRLQAAAADVAGLLRLKECVPDLLDCFAEGERELPYPPLKMWWRGSKMLRGPGAMEGDDFEAPRPLSEKRWRVKRAVVTALGKIGDSRAVAPLEAAMSRCTDFFPVTSQLAVALARLGSPSSIPILRLHRDHAEANTRKNANLALALLSNEISLADFEARAGVG